MNFNDHKEYFLNVQAGATINQSVDRGSVTGAHDIVVGGRIVLKDTAFNVPGRFLTDLGGSFDEIGLVVQKDLKTTWAVIADKNPSSY
jgi:hypothetical protein